MPGILGLRSPEEGDGGLCREGCRGTFGGSADAGASVRTGETVNPTKVGGVTANLTPHAEQPPRVPFIRSAIHSVVPFRIGRGGGHPLGAAGAIRPGWTHPAGLLLDSSSELGVGCSLVPYRHVPDTERPRAARPRLLWR